MEETIIVEFETHLFGIKGNQKGVLKIPKEYYTLTNERLKVSKQGMMTSTKTDIDLYKIKDINVIQKFKDKAMNLGDIEIISSDSSHPKLMLKKIKDPHTVREQIRTASRESRKEEGVSYRQDV
ncbi:PH domain-containing protein [Shouchella sp. 1P09AA]|uniref:PH domain-containing protein n=1 Tax=unclassified Shouchella TaxID=2893065 RepID=UPI0039A383A5